MGDSLSMFNFGLSHNCDHGEPTELTTIADIALFLSDEEGVFRAEDLGDKLLVLNLLGRSHFGQMPEELKAYSMFQFEELVVNWPDGGFPALNPGFWSGLLDYAKTNDFDSLLIHCKAGHGRTGTAAAALLIAGKNMTPKEAVEFVRQNHCEEAVETQIQINYLGWIAEAFAIENDSSDIVSSYSRKYVPEKEKKTEDEKIPNFDWDDFI
jgi:hypothetical protein